MVSHMKTMIPVRENRLRSQHNLPSKLDTSEVRGFFWKLFNWNWWFNSFNPSEKYDDCHVPNHQPVKVFSVQLNLSNQRNHPSRPATNGSQCDQGGKNKLVNGKWMYLDTQYTSKPGYSTSKCWYFHHFFQSLLNWRSRHLSFKVFGVSCFEHEKLC